MNYSFWAQAFYRIMLIDFEYLFMSVGHLNAVLEKCLFTSSVHFLKFRLGLFMLSCMSSLYILDINPLSDILLVNIFSHSLGWLFILLNVFFTIQKVFSFIRSHLFILLCCPCLRRQSKKLLLKLMSKRILPMLSSKSFMVSVLTLTLKYLVHFKLIKQFFRLYDIWPRFLNTEDSHHLEVKYGSLQRNIKILGLAPSSGNNFGPYQLFYEKGFFYKIETLIT